MPNPLFTIPVHAIISCTVSQHVFSRPTHQGENQPEKYQILPSLFLTCYCSTSALYDTHQQEHLERLETPRTLTRQWKCCGLYLQTKCKRAAYEFQEKEQRDSTAGSALNTTTARFIRVLPGSAEALVSVVATPYMFHTDTQSKHSFKHVKKKSSNQTKTWSRN